MLKNLNFYPSATGDVVMEYTQGGESGWKPMSVEAAEALLDSLTDAVRLARALKDAPKDRTFSNKIG